MQDPQYNDDAMTRHLLQRHLNTTRNNIINLFTPNITSTHPLSTDSQLLTVFFCTICDGVQVISLCGIPMLDEIGS